MTDKIDLEQARQTLIQARTQELEMCRRRIEEALRDARARLSVVSVYRDGILVGQNIEVVDDERNIDR